jgi:hypothetical protein
MPHTLCTPSASGSALCDTTLSMLLCCVHFRRRVCPSEVGRGLGPAYCHRSRLRLRAETIPRFGWIGKLETNLGQVEDLALLAEPSHPCWPPAASVSALRDLSGKFPFRIPLVAAEPR